MAIAEWCLPAFISTHKPFIIFSAPIQLRRGVTEWPWWTPGILPGSTHHSEGNLVDIQHVFAFQSLGMTET